MQSRKDVEGSLFLVKRRAQPRFQFIILNKKSAGTRAPAALAVLKLLLDVQPVYPIWQRCIQVHATMHHLHIGSRPPGSRSPAPLSALALAPINAMPSPAAPPVPVATDNFVEDVHGGFQCEVQKPYVLYRNAANEASPLLQARNVLP
jgi:hypothetical protein